MGRLMGFLERGCCYVESDTERIIPLMVSRLLSGMKHSGGGIDSLSLSSADLE